MQKATNDAAIEAYLSGESTSTISTKLKLSFSQLYRVLDKFDIPLRNGRRAVRDVKAMRSLKKDFIHQCDWCGEQLSKDQVRRRRKYCCRQCQNESIEAEKKARLMPCQAPGCMKKALDDTPYCSWRCFQISMEARFG
jgi:hypothetical protein